MSFEGAAIKRAALPTHNGTSCGDLFINERAYSGEGPGLLAGRKRGDQKQGPADCFRFSQKSVSRTASYLLPFHQVGIWRGYL